MKRILIVGACSAIATECARLWAAQGCAFALVGRNEEQLSATANDLVARGADAAHTYVLDLLDTHALPDMVVWSSQTLGGIDIAMIAHGALPDQSQCERSTSALLASLSINALSTAALLTEIAPVMEAQRAGAIGVITSVAAVRGRRSNYVYGSAKSMVSTFCEGLRVRLSHSDVSLTEIRPGFVATPMTEGLDLPGYLVVTPAAIAPRIISAIEGGKSITYTPRFWRWIALIIRTIPVSLFNRLDL